MVGLVLGLGFKVQGFRVHASSRKPKSLKTPKPENLVSQSLGKLCEGLAASLIDGNLGLESPWFSGLPFGSRISRPKGGWGLRNSDAGGVGRGFFRRFKLEA